MNPIENLNRFLDEITMIEYYSREFDNTEGLKLTNTKQELLNREEK